LLVAISAIGILLVGGAVTAHAAETRALAAPTADEKAKKCQHNNSLSQRQMVVCIATSQLGVKERNTRTRKSNNCQKYFRDFGSSLNCDDDVNGQWCAAFTRWVWAKSGVPNTPKSYLVASWASALSRVTTPKAGDVAVAQNGNHIEIVVKVSGTTVHTIDGNGGRDNVARGSHRKGGMKYYRMPS
jgi:hypothetical protein